MKMNSANLQKWEIKQSQAVESWIKVYPDAMVLAVCCPNLFYHPNKHQSISFILKVFSNNTKEKLEDRFHQVLEGLLGYRR